MIKTIYLLKEFIIRDIKIEDNPNNKKTGRTKSALTQKK